MRTVKPRRSPTVHDCQLTHLPKIVDDRGNLTFIEGGVHTPFPIDRVYWIYDVPGGERRGGHAYRELEEFVVALSGSFDVEVDDGDGRKVVPLNRSYFGLHVPRLIWRRLSNFSTNAVCLILASRAYQEEDYLREYADFLAERGENC